MTNAAKIDPHDIVEEWLSTVGPGTRDSYRGDLRRFGKWLRTKDEVGAAIRLLGCTARSAHGLILRYRSHLEGRALAPATVNRAIYSLRSLTIFACDAGDIQWVSRVRGLPSVPYRNTKGPARNSVLAILAPAGRDP